MSLLLKQVKVIDPQSKFHKKKVDILLEAGIVQKIAKSIKPSAKTEVVEEKNAHISPGWMDIGTHIGEPGYEQRETLSTVTSAAIAGGYTALAPFPNTDPIIQHKSDIQSLLSNTEELPIDFYPIAALSKDCEGKEMTEFLASVDAGAIAISDGKHYLKNDGLMERAMEYAKGAGTIIINQANNYSAHPDAMIHEGNVSIAHGLTGFPTSTEEIGIMRDLSLLAYTGSTMLIHNVSSKQGVNYIKSSKRQTKVSASVSYLNLIANESALSDFNAAYKVLPPLRTLQDQGALIKAIKAGTIDIITSNHNPIEPESKHLEFEQSEYGAIGLETCFAGLSTHLSKEIDIERLVACLSINPRRILEVPIPTIDVSAAADYTIFDPKRIWTFDKQSIHSKSANSPFIGTEFTGKVLGVINHGTFIKVD